LKLAEKSWNICFVQELYYNRIQTIVRSRNHSSFDDKAETALEEESAIFSKNDRYKNSNAESPKCSNCIQLGHVPNRCYLKDKKDKKLSNYWLRIRVEGKTVMLLVIFAKERGT
jgi:hypothetical protein